MRKCDKCQAILDDYKELLEHEAEVHPIQSLREYEPSKVKYVREVDDVQTQKD